MSQLGALTHPFDEKRRPRSPRAYSAPSSGLFDGVPLIAKVRRLEKEIGELRGFETRVKGLLAQIRRALNLLEQEIYDRERHGR